MSKPIFAGILLGLALTASPASADEANAILGHWSTPEDKSKIEIFKCGDRYCGRIASLKEPTYPLDDPKGMAGQAKVDRNNPNVDLQARPIVGLLLMEGFAYSGSSVWEGGTIYDPENGKSYKCKVTLAAPDRLEVRGFIGISLFGRTSLWTR